MDDVVPTEGMMNAVEAAAASSRLVRTALGRAAPPAQYPLRTDVCRPPSTASSSIGLARPINRVCLSVQPAPSVREPSLQPFPFVHHVRLRNHTGTPPLSPSLFLSLLWHRLSLSVAVSPASRPHTLSSSAAQVSSCSTSSREYLFPLLIPDSCSPTCPCTVQYVVQLPS